MTLFVCSLLKFVASGRGQPYGTFKLTSVTNSALNMKWNMSLKYTHTTVTIFFINLLRLYVKSPVGHPLFTQSSYKLTVLYLCMPTICYDFPCHLHPSASPLIIPASPPLSLFFSDHGTYSAGVERMAPLSFLLLNKHHVRTNQRFHMQYGSFLLLPIFFSFVSFSPPLRPLLVFPSSSLPFFSLSHQPASLLLLPPPRPLPFLSH